MGFDHSHEEPGPPGVRCLDYLDAAVGSLSAGELDRAERLAQQALASSQPGSQAEADAVHLLAFVESEQGKLDQARARYTTLRERYRSLGDVERESVAIHQLGMVARLAGDYAGAAALFDEEAALLERHLPENLLHKGANLYEQGFVKFLRKELSEAERLFREGLNVVGADGDAMVRGCLWRGLGQVLSAGGERRGAPAAYREARAAFTAAGDETAMREVEELGRSLDQEDR